MNETISIVIGTLVHKSKQSSFAWVIAHQDQKLWKGTGLAPGHANNMYSGQAEAFRMLAALLFLQNYISCFGPNLFHGPTPVFL